MAVELSSLRRLEKRSHLDRLVAWKKSFFRSLAVKPAPAAASSKCGPCLKTRYHSAPIILRVLQMEPKVWQTSRSLYGYILSVYVYVCIYMIKLLKRGLACFARRKQRSQVSWSSRDQAMGSCLLHTEIALARKAERRHQQQEWWWQYSAVAAVFIKVLAG